MILFCMASRAELFHNLPHHFLKGTVNRHDVIDHFHYEADYRITNYRL